jgi:murein DD-endopeptidase MepM/ murein hydrolase activator NlpD
MNKILIILIPLLLNVYAITRTPKKIEWQDNIYPIKNVNISSGFGARKNGHFHWGIDFRAPYGTPVIAPVDMEVEKIGWSENHGRYIIAKDEDNFYYLFAHLSMTSKLENKKILQGDVIGNVGSTGYSFGPHLHYEIYFNGVYFNPIDFSKKNFKLEKTESEFF